MSETPLKPGFYYMGYVTQASIDSMPEELRGRFKLGAPLSNTMPYPTRKKANEVAKAHSLRNITTMEITGKQP